MAKAQHQWAEERHFMAKEKHEQIMYHYKIHYILNITYITLHITLHYITYYITISRSSKGARRSST